MESLAYMPVPRSTADNGMLILLWQRIKSRFSNIRSQAIEIQRQISHEDPQSKEARSRRIVEGVSFAAAVVLTAILLYIILK